MRDQESRDTSTTERCLPLLPAMGPVPSLFDDSLLRQLIRSRPIQRLKKIGFLGAIDRILYRNRHNRYDHSIGVARLALLYAQRRHLSQHDTRVLVVAGLLHDVGHGPLSHTLEPIFKKRFGISHHQVGTKIIRGETRLGREIPVALARYGLDIDEIEAMIRGTHNGRHAFLFSSPVNVDTIEGVTRSYSIFARTGVGAISAARIVREMSRPDTLPAPKLDAFWQLKHQMYNSAIHHSAGLLYDGIAQAVVAKDIDDLVPSDFLKDEVQWQRSKRTLFKWLDRVRTSFSLLKGELPDDILSYEILAPTRQFVCQASVMLNETTDLRRRYTQTKTLHRVLIGHLLPAWRTRHCYPTTQAEFFMNAGLVPTEISEKCAGLPSPCSRARPLSQSVSVAAMHAGRLRRDRMQTAFS